MTKEQVFDVLMQAERADVSPLAAELKKTVRYAVLKKPVQELVMFRVEENVEKLDFNVGEVLTTSAEVRVKDVIGYGMVMGLDGELALDCALLMGVYEAGLPRKRDVEELAASLSRKREAALRKEKEIAGSTRVSFELIGGQDPNVSHNRRKENGGE
jgi:alpha-D-ribose 1-methylphosphonate 5-triphosphate synthase subunit PhnG